MDYNLFGMNYIYLKTAKFRRDTVEEQPTTQASNHYLPLNHYWQLYSMPLYVHNVFSC